MTPLHAALFGRRIEAALLLIERGAEVNAARAGSGRPRAGWTALHYPAGLGLAGLVQPLLDRGAEPSSRDEEGRTPLQVAIESNRHAIVSLLRERGAQ